MMTLAGICARVRATEIIHWPQSVLDHAFARPAFSIKVTGTGAALRAADAVPAGHPHDLFPKLGVKSWQETGRLRIIRAGLPLAQGIAARLATPTRIQLALLPAWAEDPLYLHLFDWQDFSRISEARYLVSGERCGITNLCLRGPGAEDVTRRTARFAHDLAAGAAARLHVGSLIVQVAITPDARVSILDINPALTPAECNILMPPAAVG